MSKSDLCICYIANKQFVHFYGVKKRLETVLRLSRSGIPSFVVFDFFIPEFLKNFSSNTQNFLFHVRDIRKWI